MGVGCVMTGIDCDAMGIGCVMTEIDCVAIGIGCVTTEIDCVAIGLVGVFMSACATHIYDYSIPGMNIQVKPTNRLYGRLSN